MSAQASCPRKSQEQHPQAAPCADPEVVVQAGSAVASPPIPVPGSEPIAAPVGQAVAETQAGSESVPAAAARCPATEQAASASPEEVVYRLEEIMDWLVDGLAPQQAVMRAQELWGVSRRMAQIYVQRARRRLARQEEENERSYLAWLAQRQRDRLLQYVLGVLAAIQQWEPQRIHCVVSLVHAACRLLECRDKALIQRQRFQEQQERRKRKEEIRRTVEELEAFLQHGIFPPGLKQELPFDGPLVPRKDRRPGTNRPGKGTGQARKTAPRARSPRQHPSGRSGSVPAARSRPCPEPAPASPPAPGGSPQPSTAPPRPQASASRPGCSEPGRTTDTCGQPPGESPARQDSTQPPSRGRVALGHGHCAGIAPIAPQRRSQAGSRRLGGADSGARHPHPR
jgi:hypothetical protein